MGCGASGASKGAAAPASKKAKLAAAATAKATAERKKLLNPEDFIIRKRNGESIVKAEGSIRGEQFNIEECTDCDIFLLDHIATTFIDQCVGCRIFVGPVESSVMMRECKSCSMVIACQQFRSRDCTDCRLALFCVTEPIIETSINMQFACFDFGYFSLRQQLDRAGLKLWNNKWWQIYDFNKNEERPNWSLLPQEEATRLLRVEACGGAVSSEELTMDRVVPVTLGSRPWPSQESCLVLFLPDTEAEVEALLDAAVKREGWSVCRTRSMALDEGRLQALFAWSKERKIVSACKGKLITGIELCGAGILTQVQDALAGASGGSKGARVVPEQEVPALGKAFFETWKDEI